MLWYHGYLFFWGWVIRILVDYATVVTGYLVTGYLGCMDGVD